MKHYSIVLVLLLVASQTSVGQFKKIRSLEVSDTITSVAVDRPGDFYVTTRDGQLQHFDVNGKLYSVYKNQEPPTFFDPRDGSRLFAYYRERQQYAWLNPTFEPSRVVTVDSAFFIDPWLICSSGDYNLWILDAADWSLRRVDTRESKVVVESTLAFDKTMDKRDLIMMREYLGFVFLLDKKSGIHIYSSMGKLLRTLPASSLRYLNFLGQDLYYLQGSSLQFFDLYSTETRSVKLPVSCTFALLTDERLYCFKDKKVEIFQVR